MKLKLGLTLAIIVMASTAHAAWPKWEDTNVYIATEVGMHTSELKSGGFNTAGGFENENDDQASGTALGLKIGVDYLSKLRLDVAFRQYNRLDFTTDSFAPPNPTFFYDSTMKARTFMISAYYDFLQFKKLDIYGGAGIGMSRTKLETTDGVVEGSGSATNFAWHVELGVEYPIMESFMLNLGIRYADLGETEINLTNTGQPAGDFSADITVQEAFIGLRFIF